MRKRNKQKKFTSRDILEFRKGWENGKKENFREFIKAYPPYISGENGPEPVRTDCWQFEVICEFMEDPVKRQAILSWPRRTGKSLWDAVVQYYLFMMGNDQIIVILANSLAQAEDTVWSHLLDMIQKTPLAQECQRAGLLKYIPSAGRVYFQLKDELGRIISTNIAKLVSSQPKSSLGRRITSVAATEGGDDANIKATLNVMGSAVSNRGKCLAIMDSTIGVEGSVFNNMLKNPPDTIFTSYKFHDSVEEMMEKAPSWFDKDFLMGLIELDRKAYGDVRVNQYWLNKIVSSSNRLIPPEDFENNERNHIVVVQDEEDFEDIDNQYYYRDFCGIDLANNLTGEGDKSCGVRVRVKPTAMGPDIQVLEEFIPEKNNQLLLIDWLDGICPEITAIEDYNASLLYQTVEGHNPILYHPSTYKEKAVLLVKQMFAYDRIRIHPSCKNLIEQVKRFKFYKSDKSSRFKYSGKDGGAAQDDVFMAFVWAIFAITENLDFSVHIRCHRNKPEDEQYRLNCAILHENGSKLPPCHVNCDSYKETAHIWEKYKDPDTGRRDIKRSQTEALRMRRLLVRTGINNNE